MGDPRRFWKESIGVVGPARPGRAVAPAAPAVPAGVPAVPTPAAAKPPERPAPATHAVHVSTGSPTEQIVLSLPHGSIAFGDDVARKLWPRPTAAELKSLATIIEHQRRIPTEARELVFRCVAVRQRMLRLSELSNRPSFDAVTLHARAAEWTRLARLARETAPEIEPYRARAESPALDAALALLPAAGALDATASLVNESAMLAESASEGRAIDALRTLSNPDAIALLEALRTGTPRPDDELFVEIVAAATLTRRAAESGRREELDELRLGLALLSERLETTIGIALAEHRRDPQRNARQAEWKRCLAGLRGRVDEALTRPDGVAATPPVAAPCAAAPAPVPAIDEDAIRERLREVRARAEATLGTAPAPAKRPFWRRWFSPRGDDRK